MGEAPKDALRVEFDHSVKLEFQGSTVSSDSGLLAYGQVDDAFGLTAMADHALRDLRTGSNVQHRPGRLRGACEGRSADSALCQP